MLAILFSLCFSFLWANRKVMKNTDTPTRECFIPLPAGVSYRFFQYVCFFVYSLLPSLGNTTVGS